MPLLMCLACKARPLCYFIPRAGRTESDGMKSTRRWLSVSLRTMLIGVTMLSAVFAWFLHHRQTMVRSRERFEKILPSQVKLTFRDSLLGADLPQLGRDQRQKTSAGDRWWLGRWAAGPRLHAVEINNWKESRLPDDFPAFVRQAREVQLHHCDFSDRELRQWFSANTESLEIVPASGFLSTQGLTCLAAAPNLKRLRLEAYYFGRGYGAHCLQAILSHPALEEIEFWPDLADLAEVPATGQPHSLKVLKLRLYRTDRQPQVEQEFAWLKDCCELRRIEYRATEPSTFLLKAS